MKSASYIPKDYNTITPSLAFKGTEAAINWYVTVFRAKEKMRMEGPDKKIMHAELTVGDSTFFLAEEMPQYKNVRPETANGNSIKLYLYVEDVDDVVKKAVQNGATLVMPVKDQFYGDRCGSIDDPFGYTWVLATHTKDVTEKEMQKKAEEMEFS